MNTRHNGGPLGDGWIARHRSVRDHWLVGHGIHVKPADPTRKKCLNKGEAWEDMLMECRYEAATISNGGKKMELRRGEMVGAVSWLAHRWNWTPKTVRGFLDDLENDGMIELKNPASEKGDQKGRQANIISACNYDYYQSGHGEARQPKGRPEGDDRATKGRPEGNIYKDNKGTREQGNNLSPSPLQGEGREDIHPPRDLDGRGDDAPEAAPRRRNPRMAHWLPQDKPDGSNGIDWRDGKLTVFNGTAAALAKEFPTLDLAAVCNKAAPRVANIKNPTQLQVLAAIRAQCQYELDYQAKAPPARTGGNSKDPFAGLDAKSRAKVEAARLAKQREGQ